MAATTTELTQRLKDAKVQMAAFETLRKEAKAVLEKEAFQPAPAMPQGGAPPADPSMQQGAPVDPAMQQAMMQQGGMPADPAMMQQGAPPMDPAAGSPSVSPEQWEEVMSLLEKMAGGLTQLAERINQIEAQVQQQGQSLGEMEQTLASAMQPSPEEAGAPQGGW